MKGLIPIIALVLFGCDIHAQSCNLTEDRTDAYGNILRGAEWSYSSYGGTNLDMMLNRTINRYTFLFTIDQPINEAVNFSLDGNVHPIIFNLSNGATVKAWVSKAGVYSSSISDGRVTFSEEYTILTSELSAFSDAEVSTIVFRCSGRSTSTGNATNEIRFPLNSAEGQTLSQAIRCLQKEAEPVALKAAPAPRRSEQAVANKATSGEQEELLRNLIQAVIDGNGAIKQSVDVSGTAQLEQNHLMMEKIENLTDAIEKLNETKKEEALTPRVFGFGVYFKSNYYFSEVFVPFNEDIDLLPAKFLAGTSINMSFSAGMKKKVGFRFEPYVDFLFSNNSQTNSGSTQRMKSSAQQVEAGLKLLVVARRNRVNIYSGLTGGYISLSAKSSSETIGVVSFSRQKVVRQGGNVGLILGGEYLITPHFGIRLESGMLYYLLGDQKNTTETNFGSGTNSDSETTKVLDGRFSTFGRLGGSFYF